MTAEPGEGGVPPTLLPLGLLRPPPGLIQVLDQEGIPWIEVGNNPGPPEWRPRFVLIDGRPSARVSDALRRADQVVLDVGRLRRGWAFDPFAALLDGRARRMSWHVDGAELIERVARIDRAAIRDRLLAALRSQIEAAGGVWVRQAAFPAPYRSAFNLRVDLDEPIPEHYFAFARRRAELGLDACTTHFVSTAAYGRDARVLRDLRGLDAQSHGHHHAVYRDPVANERNLRRADDLLRRAGIGPIAFAAPGGRWNPGLDGAAEALEYHYGSEFSIGRDDLPFFPWRGDADRFSRVLQVPIHPVCEGHFFDAGLRDPRAIASYYRLVVDAKLEAGVPAFVYGHPERRLALLPGVLRALADRVIGDPAVWRCSLTEFAAWWRRRLRRRWSVVEAGAGHLEIRIGDDNGRLTLELMRGDGLARFSANQPMSMVHPDHLTFERRPDRPILPLPSPARGPWGPRSIVRGALDWERATPVADLPDRLWRDRLKKRLRAWQESRWA